MQSINSFSPETLLALKSYVYALVDPAIDPSDPRRFFYIGKGVNQRCFQHAAAEIGWIPDKDGPDPKLDIVRRIRSDTASPPPVVIVKSGLTDEESLALEAVLIGLLRGRANRQSGNHAAELWLPAAHVDAKTANPIPLKEIRATVLLVSLNGGGTSPAWPGIQDTDVPGRVLGDWMLGEAKANKVEYIAGVYRDLIRCVFKVSLANGKAEHIPIDAGKSKSGARKTRRRFVGHPDLDKGAEWELRRIVGADGETLTKFGRRQAWKLLTPNQ
jgi:hypothetical protein